jgi:hypothetical protein
MQVGAGVIEEDAVARSKCGIRGAPRISFRGRRNCLTAAEVERAAFGQAQNAHGRENAVVSRPSAAAGFGHRRVNFHAVNTFEFLVSGVGKRRAAASEPDGERGARRLDEQRGTCARLFWSVSRMRSVPATPTLST